MFDKLEQKIRFMVILIIAFSIIISSILLYLALQRNIFNDFTQLSVQYSRQQDRNADLYLSLIEETSKLLTTDEDIIQALQRPKFDSVLVNKAVAKLSGIQTSSVTLTGITMYGLNQVCYSSESIGLAPNNPPSLKQLMSNPLFKRFADSKQPTLWWVRYQKLLKYPIYNSNFRDGLMTLALKIFNSNNQLIGFLLVDMKMNSFLQFFTDREQKNEVYCLTGENKVLRVPFTKKPAAAIATDIKKAHQSQVQFRISSDRRRLYIFFPIPHSADKIVKVIPYTGIYLQLMSFLILLVILNLCFITLAVISSKMIARSVSQPLTTLYRKMQRHI